MNGTAFDTPATVKALREAGFDEHRAEAVAQAVRNATGAERDTLATKADLKAGLAALETQLTVRMVVVGGSIVAAIECFQAAP